MIDDLRPPDFIAFRQAACGILERNAGDVAIEMFGLGDVLGRVGTDLDLTPVYAFLEAQGYQGAVTPALGRLGVTGLPEHAELSGIREQLVLGHPLSDGGLVAVPGMSPDVPIAVDRIGLGLVVLRNASIATRVIPADEADDYLTLVQFDCVDAAVMVPEEHMNGLRATIRARVQLGAAAELLGLSERILDDAMAYARARRQFGRPVTGFQAMQHLLAWATTERHQLASLFDIAVARAACAHVDPALSRAVKAMAGRVLHLSVQAATQVTGAISFTWEYPLNRLHRRGLALDQIGGSSAELIVAMGRDLRTEGVVPELFDLCDLVESSGNGPSASATLASA